MTFMCVFLLVRIVLYGYKESTTSLVANYQCDSYFIDVISDILSILIGSSPKDQD